MHFYLLLIAAASPGWQIVEFFVAIYLAKPEDRQPGRSPWGALGQLEVAARPCHFETQHLEIP